MTGESTVSGVDRYMEMLTEYLVHEKSSLSWQVLRACLISDNKRLGVELVERGIKILYIPLPSCVQAIIDEALWRAGHPDYLRAYRR